MIAGRGTKAGKVRERLFQHLAAKAADRAGLFRHADEFGRRDDTTFWMNETHQGLVADGATGADFDDRLEEGVEPVFGQAFLDSITHRWGGALGVARDWCPTVSIDRKNRIAWAGNYVGDGVATSNLAGRILRNLILEQDEDINALPLVNHRSPSWEPEPLRWLGVNSGLAAASLSDIEERITHRPSRTAMLLEKLTGAH